jgi:glycylpeptide N-tetradecanoyltransferase
VVYSYVRTVRTLRTTGDEEDVVTDVCSFFGIDTVVVPDNGPQKELLIRAAYSYLNVATSVPLQELMQEALVFASQHGFDVFFALDSMNNEEFLRDLKFEETSGRLKYYMHNWRCPAPMIPSDVGLILP